MVRYALTGDVPDGCLQPISFEGGNVGVRVLRCGHRGRVVGVHTFVVLVCEHQHRVTVVLCQPVSEGLTRALPLAGAVAGEPHLDLVTRLGTPYDSPELGVVDLGLVAIAFTAAPLPHGDTQSRLAIDRIVHGQIPPVAARGAGHRLRIAVRDGEAVHL